MSFDHMTRADKALAESRLHNHLICKKCNARNPKRATRCRKCGYSSNPYRRALRRRRVRE